MTANEAIEEIRRQSADGRAVGFQVLSMDEVDVEAYADDGIFERFKALPMEAQERFLSSVMDEMYTTLEEHPDFGFRFLFESTVEDLETENVTLDVLMDEASKEVADAG